MFKTRYFYYFQSNLSKHFHFYKAVSDVCKGNDFKLELITFVKLKDYFNIRNVVKEFKQSKSHVFFILNRNITILVYFFFVILFNKKTVIHFKQTSPGKLSILRNMFPNKVVFITDMEGDKISEREYLLKEAKDKKELSKEDEKEIENIISQELVHLNLFDYIFVYNSHFKELLFKRHPTLNAEIKVSHLMSFKKNELYFDEYLREEYRLKLKWGNYPIMVYIGNIYYSWQNISKTILLYKRTKLEVNSDAKLLLLINKSDHLKALEFIHKHNLEDDDYILDAVQNNEIRGYLNAADIGIVLRDFHPMNQMVTSGKLLDYLGCGLPVITTSVLLNFPDNSKMDEYGLILNKLDINNMSLDKVAHFFNCKNDFRTRISVWANENLSLDSMSAEYINLLKEL